MYVYVCYDIIFLIYILHTCCFILFSLKAQTIFAKKKLATILIIVPSGIWRHASPMATVYVPTKYYNIELFFFWCNAHFQLVITSFQFICALLIVLFSYKTSNGYTTCVFRHFLAHIAPFACKSYVLNHSLPRQAVLKLINAFVINFFFFV